MPETFVGAAKSIPIYVSSSWKRTSASGPELAVPMRKRPQIQKVLLREKLIFVFECNDRKRNGLLLSIRSTAESHRDESYTIHSCPHHWLVDRRNVAGIGGFGVDASVVAWRSSAVGRICCDFRVPGIGLFWLPESKAQGTCFENLGWCDLLGLVRGTGQSMDRP